MYVAAREICRARGWEIDCRYLKVSRFAMRLPEYHLLGKACLERICVAGIRVTFEKIMRRAGLNEEEILAVAGATGFQDQTDRELLYPEIMALKPVLAECPLFMQLVWHRSKKAYPCAMAYLEQEGLFDDVPYALVDSGWVGTLQLTLEHLLQTKQPNRRLKGYYFGIYEIPRETGPEQYRGFYFGPKNGLRRKVHFSNCLFETVFSASEGMTLGYCRTASGIEAKESIRANCNAEDLKRYNGLLKRFLNIYCGKAPVNGKVSCPVSPKILSAFMGHPQSWEVQAFGDKLFCDDVLEGTLQEVAAVLSEDEIHSQRLIQKAMLMLGLKKAVLHESAWIEGSIVRCGLHVRRNLAQARLYKYFLYLRKLWKNR